MSRTFPSFSLLIIGLLISFILGAQSYQPPKKSEPVDLPSSNAFFVELLGNGGAYSINYERLFLTGPPLSFRGRTGVSFFGGRFTFPVMISTSHPLLGPLEMEWGGGVLLIPDFQKGGLVHQWSARGGIRYSNSQGLLLRLAYTPFFRSASKNEKWIRHWGGLSIGLLF
ncbi:MAG: hypothetical protein ABEH38_05675 [Flavobacteriales bacterium]